MLRSENEIRGYRIAAKDGPVGKVKDFLFDEEHWTVRYMVADTGTWLPGRKVLISPITLGRPDWAEQLFPVRMTKDEIESMPELDSDAPVSREYEKHWFDRYGFPYYWGGVSAWGPAAAPTSLFTGRETQEAVEAPPEAAEGVLRSMKEVKGYHIEAQDGEIGHVDDFILDDESWAVRYVVIDTKNWLPGRKVLISPAWIENISWIDRDVWVDLEREIIKESPTYDPSQPINREYESRLYDYYGRPVYWT